MVKDRLVGIRELEEDIKIVNEMAKALIKVTDERVEQLNTMYENKVKEINSLYNKMADLNQRVLKMEEHLRHSNFIKEELTIENERLREKVNYHYPKGIVDSDRNKTEA